MISVGVVIIILRGAGVCAGVSGVFVVFFAL